MDVDGPDADVNPDPNANVDLNVYAYGTNPKRISEKQRQKERRATRWDVSLADIAREAKGLGYKSSMAHNAGSGSSSSKDSPRPGWEDNLAIYIRDVSPLLLAAFDSCSSLFLDGDLSAHDFCFA